MQPRSPWQNKILLIEHWIVPRFSPVYLSLVERLIQHFCILEKRICRQYCWLYRYEFDNADWASVMVQKIIGPSLFMTYLGG